MTHWLQRKGRIWTVVFFIALTVVGLMTVRDYGVPYDEVTETIIFKANVKEYALRLEGEDSRSFAATLNMERISASIERDHGMCAYYPLIPFLQTLDANQALQSYWWSVLTWLWFMVGCLSLYGVARELGLSRPLACLTTLGLYLMPRFFAEGHYNNKDVVLLCLVLLTLWLGARLLRRPTLPGGLLFSLAGAMATNVKIVGILPWGLMGLAIVLRLTLERGWSARVARVAVATLVGYPLLYLALTPAAWDQPLAFVRYLLTNAQGFSRFGGVVLFRGAEFYDVGGKTPLPWYYLPYYIMTTVPLFLLALAGIGQAGAIRRCFSHGKPDARTYLLLAATLCWLLPVGYTMVRMPILYNGWRHFYFAYAGVAVLAGWGLDRLWRWARERKRLRGLAIGALTACYALTALGIALNHPYEFAYFNPLVKRDAVHSMDLDTWNVGCAGAVERLYALKQPSGNERLRIGCYFNDLTYSRLKLPAEVAKHVRITVNADEPYLYYPSTYAYIYRAAEPPEGYHALFAVQSYGNTVGVMYEKDEGAPS